MVGLAMMHAEGSRAQGCSEFGEARVLRPSLLPRWLGLVWAAVRSYAQTAPAFACVHSSSDPNTLRGRTASGAVRNGHGCPRGNAAHPTQGAHSSRRSIRTPQGVDRGAAWATLCCLAAHQRRRLPRPLHGSIYFWVGRLLHKCDCRTTLPSSFLPECYDLQDDTIRHFPVVE